MGEWLIGGRVGEIGVAGFRFLSLRNQHGPNPGVGDPLENRIRMRLAPLNRHLHPLLGVYNGFWGLALGRLPRHRLILQAKTRNCVPTFRTKLKKENNMTLDPCQLPINYTSKITAVKRFIVDKVDASLGTVYDSASISLTVDFGITTVNNVKTDNLTNRIKQVFGDVSDSFVNQARTDAIDAAQNDYLAVGWQTVVFTMLPGEIPQYMSVVMNYVGPCPI